MVLQVSQKLAVPERRACKVLEQARAAQRRNLSPPSDEQQLTDDIIALAAEYGRYGYRRVTALLNDKHGRRVNHKRVGRIWRKEGRRYYWRLFFSTLLRNPRFLPLSISFAIQGFHFRKVVEKVVGQMD